MKSLRNIIILILILCADPLFADVPVREEQLIYSILAFNGKDYSRTFARQDAHTIYLIANVDNFISVRKTFVYFWPLTQDYKLDSSTLNIPFEGTIEIEGREQESKKIGMIPYTFYNIRGEYELNWKVDTGKRAYKAWEHYQKLIDTYWESVREYRIKLALYENLAKDLIARINKMRERGQDITKLVDTMQEMKAPPKPQFPNEYNYPPVPVQKAFIINLPAGEYSIRFFTKDGKVMEGSERKIVTFERRRAEGIGMEVIPGDRWTRPVESMTPASIIYTDGSTDFYLQPFYQQEYNDLYYEKMKKNDSKGNPGLNKWIRIQQVPKARIEVTYPGTKSETILEEPFYVEQVESSTLGYKIVPYDQEGKHKNREPSLKAFHISISKNQRIIRLIVQDKNGEYLPSSERQIRVIHYSQFSLIFMILAVLPLVVMIIVLVRRSRMYTS